MSISPKIVGVINATPDSYHAQSRAEDVDEALALAGKYLTEGVDILEIGGESTGPRSVDVTVDDEKKRVLPVLEALRKKFRDTPIAVDTWKSSVAAAALESGATIINDVTAGRGDPAMFPLLASHPCQVVLMYSKDPDARTSVADQRYDDVIATIHAFLRARIAAAKAAGIDPARIIVDPGLGHFVSSDPFYSYEILSRLSAFGDLGPVMVSPSRKSFLAGPSNLPASERLPATVAASVLAACTGARFIRTHDVGAVEKALEATTSLRS